MQFLKLKTKMNNIHEIKNLTNERCPPNFLDFRLGCNPGTTNALTTEQEHVDTTVNHKHRKI